MAVLTACYGSTGRLFSFCRAMVAARCELSNSNAGSRLAYSGQDSTESGEGSQLVDRGVLLMHCSSAKMSENGIDDTCFCSDLTELPIEDRLN